MRMRLRGEAPAAPSWAFQRVSHAAVQSDGRETVRDHALRMHGPLCHPVSSPIFVELEGNVMRHATCRWCWGIV